MGDKTWAIKNEENIPDNRINVFLRKVKKHSSANRDINKEFSIFTIYEIIVCVCEVYKQQYYFHLKKLVDI